MTATTLALRALLTASEAYTSAAQAHHEASLYGDDGAMGQANIDAEQAYAGLVKAQRLARMALGDAPKPRELRWCDQCGEGVTTFCRRGFGNGNECSMELSTPIRPRCNLCGCMGSHLLQCPNAGT